MAFVRVHENSHLEESGRDENGRIARRVFEVVADAPTSNVEAETASATNPAAYGGATVTIPVIGAAHPSDSTRKVTNVSVERDEESTVGKPKFSVKVDYSTPTTDTPTSTDPLSEPTKYRWSFNPATAPLFRDLSSARKPIVNSAGEPFDFIFEGDVDELMVEVTKNESSYDPAAAIAINQRTNSNTFTVDGWVVPVGTAKMIGPTAEKHFDSTNTAYYTKTWVLRFREEGWKEATIDDRGFNQKDPDNAGKLKEIVKGTPPVKPDQPWPLDGDGAAKANSTDAPAELVFQVTKEASFPNL